MKAFHPDMLDIPLFYTIIKGRLSSVDCQVKLVLPQISVKCYILERIHGKI